MKNKRKLFLTTLICLLPMVYGLFVFRTLPEQIPTHWNLAGEVNGYSNRTMVVFGIPAFLAGINLICQIGLNTDPNKKGHPRQLRTLFDWFVPGLTIVVMATVYLSVNGETPDVPRIMSILGGVIFLIIGNYLPKCRQNYTMGIKLPWTLNSVENWNRTHRLGGFTWMIAGVLILLTAVFQLEVLMFVIIVVSLLIPTVYSYLLYRKGI